MADNHTLFNAPALFDSELIVLDPAGVFEQMRQVVAIEAAHTTGSDLPVVNGASGPDALGLAELLHRRREELTRALEHGAVVVVFLHPVVTMPAVAGFSGADNYFFLPAPAGVAWDTNTIHWGEGQGGAVLDHAHPFAAAVEAIRSGLHYRAYLDERAPGIAGSMQPFARSAGGAVLGAHFPVLNGHVIFLPTPAERGGALAGPLAATILDGALELLGRAGGSAEPRWSLEEDLPGLAELEATEAQAQAAAQAAQEAATHATQAADEARAMRALLWVRGRHAIEPAAVRCLEAVGFKKSHDESGARLTSPQGTIHVEAEASEEPVGMAPHYRLRRRLDALLESDGTAGRGLVVAAGMIGRSPKTRDQAYIDALATGAEATRYALITAPDLFAAARYALTDPGDETLAAIRTALIETDGVITFDLPAPQAD